MKYDKLAKQLNLSINKEELFDNAFVHRSYLNEHPELKMGSNERLEFLGDAILELVTTDALFKNYPDREEGDLTNIRSALVKGEALAEVARKLELGEFLILSKGEEKSGGRKKGYILANTLEALLGAVYLDEGYEKTAEVITKTILARTEEVIENKLYIDSKSYFQEKAQAHEGITPNYELIEETGPDHNKKFIMGVYIGEKKITEGEGSSKQTAEQDAAQKAIEQLKY